MNGIDRVFVSALNTVKRLPSSPSSPKPPLDERLLLYGLFKQSMEGDIPASMLQTLKHDPVDDEEDANREKTEAWADQRGTTKTEAKKLYITTLIQSMRQYGSKTETARSLIDELEFVWNQVNGNHDDLSQIHSRSNSGSQRNFGPARVAEGQEEEEEEGDEGDDEEEEDEEAEEDLLKAPPNVFRTAPPSPSKPISQQRTGESRLQNPSSMLLSGGGGQRSAADDERWKRQVEQALQQIRAELASVRESLLHASPSASNLFGVGSGAHASQQSILSQVLTRLYKLFRISLTVALYDIIFLLAVYLVFRRRGDMRAKRVEAWVKNLWNWILGKTRMRIRTGVKSIGDRR